LAKLLKAPVISLENSATKKNAQQIKNNKENCALDY